MERSLRAARAATFVYFALDGTLMGMWLVQIPAIEKQAGISNATLGSLLVLLGLGAIIGMQVAGRLADRLGARVVVPAAGVLCGAALVLPGLARVPWALAGALLVFGFGNGCLDVSMNAHAVHVEKAYNRPVMSAFHATFSIGGVIAALLGARAISAGISPAATLGAAGAAGIAIALLPARGLLATTASAAERPTEPASKRRTPPRRIWILAGLALMCMLCEGVANDWSTLDAKTVLGASASTASFAYGTFAGSMTIGRLLADRVSRRFGSAAVLRYGAATGAAGLTIVVYSPWIWTALLGWAVFGLGLSGCVPPAVQRRRSHRPRRRGRQRLPGGRPRLPRDAHRPGADRLDDPPDGPQPDLPAPGAAPGGHRRGRRDPPDRGSCCSASSARAAF